MSWKTVKARQDLQLSDISVQPAEDARVVARDVEDLVSLQVKATVQGIDQHLHRGDKDVKGLGEQGDCWVEFDFHGCTFLAHTYFLRFSHQAEINWTRKIK